MKRRWKYFGGAAAVLGTVAFGYYMLSSLHFGDLVAHLNARFLVTFIVAVGLYCLILPLSALAWRRMLADMGHRDRFWPLHAILLTTQAGKYLPGNVGQHLGRISLSLARGIPLRLLLATMAYEVILLLLANLLVAVCAGALTDTALAFLLQSHSRAIAIAGAIVVAGLLAIPLLLKLAPKVIRVLLRNRGDSDSTLAPLGVRSVAKVLGLYACAMLSVGAAISVLQLGLFPGQGSDYALLTAAFTVAWAVGFVTPGAPAGIGVRESMLLLMLSGKMGAENASLLIVALRVATTVGDLACFVTGLALTAWLQKHGKRETGVSKTTY